MSELYRVAGADTLIAERRYARLERLRLFRPTTDQIAVLSGRIGVDLVQTPNRVGLGVGRAVWLGPDEWLLIDQPSSAAAMLEPGEGPASLLNTITDGHWGLLVSGSGALDLLARACPLDLHPRVFAPGQSALSLFVQVPVLVIWQPDGAELVFDISLRGYVLDWVNKAIASFV